MKTLIFILIAIATSNLMAHHKKICVREFNTKIGVNKNLSSECKIAEEMYLTYKYHTYPNLRDNPRKVYFYQGSYRRDIITTTKYLNELINVCNGDIIRSQVTEVKSREKVYFVVNNPNLSAEITESYMLSPITELEATEEMDRIKRNCEKYSLDE